MALPKYWRRVLFKEVCEDCLVPIFAHDLLRWSRDFSEHALIDKFKHYEYSTPRARLLKEPLSAH